MFMGTCADMRPIRIIFSPVSGWKAESKTYLAFHSSSSVSPGETIPCLLDSKRRRLQQVHPGFFVSCDKAWRPCVPVVTDDFVSVSQLLVGEEDVPRVCDSEEMLGSSHKCALVPPGFLNVYGSG